MITVEFMGVVGERFGTGYKVDAKTPQGAVSALCHMIDGLRDYVRHNDFIVFIDEENISEEALGRRVDDVTVTVGLHVSGAGGGGGVFALVAGIALVVVGFINPAAWGAGAQMLAIGLGAGIAATGAATLLMPTPKIDQADPDGNKASYGFSNPVTTVAQGNNVPVLYGKGLIGGFVIMYRITTDDI